VALAVAAHNDPLAMSIPFTGHPDILKSRMAKSALNLLRLRMLRGATTT
jgi:hypothetical protein